MAKFLDENGLLYLWGKIRAQFVAKESGKGLSTNDYTAEEKEKLAGLSNYTLPAASAETLGGVKVGAGLAMADGVLSATGGGVADSVAWENVQNKPASFPPSAHTHTAAEITGLEIPAVSTSIEADAESDGKAASPKAVKTYVDGKVSAVYKPQGSVAFASLPALSASLLGNVYNVTNAFVTTADFLEGAGISHAAGTNVVCVQVGGTYKWDALSGNIDLSEYLTKSEVTALTNAEIDDIIATVA